MSYACFVTEAICTSDDIDGRADIATSSTLTVSFINWLLLGSGCSSYAQ